MKKILLLSPFILISNLFAFVGLGFQFGENKFSVAENSPIPQLINGSFDNAFNFGGYIYIDALPIIDIDVDFSAQGNTYKIQFSNDSGQMSPLSFGWASTDLYITIRKEIVGFKIPFLAKTKLFAGGGYNSHSTTPLANESVISNLLGGSIQNDPANLSSGLESYLSNEENYLKSTGFHIQAGIQFKLLILDSFLFYRQVFADNVIPNSDSYSSINMRVGIGL